MVLEFMEREVKVLKKLVSLVKGKKVLFIGTRMNPTVLDGVSLEAEVWMELLRKVEPRYLLIPEKQ